MSYTITTDVFCDVCGNWINGATGHKIFRKLADQVAKQQGWKRFKHLETGELQHICPPCQKSITRKRNSRKEE